MIIDHTKLYMRYITMRQTAIDDKGIRALMASKWEYKSLRPFTAFCFIPNAIAGRTADFYERVQMPG